MAKESGVRKRNPRALVGLIILAACFQFLTTDSFAQLRTSESLLNRISARASNNLKVAFTYSPKFPVEGQPVQFVASVSGNPSSWRWDFGDGTTSTDRNPSHAYLESGFHRVTLVATAGSATKTAARTLTVIPATSNATFMFSPSTPGPGESVQFTDTTSESPTSWQWNFGDGTTSSVKNPNHAFGQTGTYTVSLVASTSSGPKQGSRAITVASMSVLAASFSYAPANPVTGQTIQFTDTSSGNPTTWSWNFGDGTTSTLQNPAHAYATAGPKTVTLTVTDGSGTTSSVRTITITAPLEPSFSFAPAAPLTGQSVQFTDTSSGSPTSWSWNFGDGATSTAQNPSHAYATAGAKTVTLTVGNGLATAAATRTVSVATSLDAAFTFAPASPAVGQTVQFTDASTGSPTSWSWSFGDGATSTARNPSHAYASAGTRTVTLTVGDGSGTASVSRAVTVTASNTVTASFSFSPSAPAAAEPVQFTDTSTGGPTSWQWSFGDGGTSTVQNPSHVYASAGTYTVSLTAAAGSSAGTTTRTVTVAAAASLDAAFTFSPSAPAPGQTVRFTDTSTGNPTSWSWSFGDGGTSTAQNPSHTFASAGSYAVTLIAGNASGTDTASRNVTVATSSEVLPGDRIYDWTLAGVPGGIPARSTIFRTLTAANSTSEINAAIAACPSGQVVYLAAGTYSLGTITLGSKSGVTLRGAGPGRTIINTTAGDAIVTDGKTFYEADALNVSSGYAAGSQSIVLASTPSSAFAVGNLIMITEDASPNTFGEPGVGVYYRSGMNSPYGLTPSRCFRFSSRITGVSGNTVTFATPIPYSFAASLNPHAIALRGGRSASLCGVEDMTVVGGGSSDKAVEFMGADRCWVKNVEVSNFYGGHGAIYLQASVQCEVRRCYVHDAADYPNQSDGYSYFLYYGCGSCLIVDNIAYRTGQQVVNGSVCNAVLYNYDIDARRAGLAFLSESVICNHGPQNMFNLYEGNITQRWQSDGYHGSASHTTIFRNFVHGLCSTQPNPSTRRILDLCRGSYFHNVVGNVLGDASWTPADYEHLYGDSGSSCIYILGFPGMDSMSMGAFTSVPWAGWTKSISQPDADVAGTLLRHGNYDFYNRGTVWDPGISSRTLPDSLYYGSKPAFFGSLQWPAIGPDVPGLVRDIPARARWNAYQASGSLSDLFRDF
jgi:PKD repeat protein